MNRRIAPVLRVLTSVLAHGAGFYTLTAVNTYNPFSPTGTAVISGPVPTAGTATVDAGGNVAVSVVRTVGILLFGLPRTPSTMRCRRRRSASGLQVQ